MDIDFYKKPQYIKDCVKELRKNQTKAETILRDRLRNKKLNGYKFYRQKAIFVYRENESWDRFILLAHIGSTISISLIMLTIAAMRKIHVYAHDQHMHAIHHLIHRYSQLQKTLTHLA